MLDFFMKLCIILIVSFATLAQLVERHFCKVDVPSSSLGGGSRKIEITNPYFSKNFCVRRRCGGKMRPNFCDSHSVW